MPTTVYHFRNEILPPHPLAVGKTGRVPQRWIVDSVCRVSFASERQERKLFFFFSLFARTSGGAFNVGEFNDVAVKRRCSFQPYEIAQDCKIIHPWRGNAVEENNTRGGVGYWLSSIDFKIFREHIKDTTWFFLGERNKYTVVFHQSGTSSCILTILVIPRTCLAFDSQVIRKLVPLFSPYFSTLRHAIVQVSALVYSCRSYDVAPLVFL